MYGRPMSVPVDVGADARRLRDEPADLQAARLQIRHLLGVRVVGRQRRNGRKEHAHRVGVAVEAFEDGLDVSGQPPVFADSSDPPRPFRVGRQLSEEEQVGRVEECAVGGELLDGIAAVEEDAFVAVDEGNPASACGRVLERRIVGHQSEVVVGAPDPTEVHRANRAVLNGNLVLFARAVVGDCQRVGHNAIRRLGRGQGTRVTTSLDLRWLHRASPAARSSSPAGTGTR